MTITREFVQSVRSRIAVDPAISLETLSCTLEAPEAYIIMALPVGMRTRVQPSDMEALWESMVTLESLSLHYASSEISTSSVGKNSKGSGTDLSESAPPFSQEEIGFIWLVSQPTSSGDNCSVRFFDKNGHTLLCGNLSSGGLTAC